MVMRYIPDQGDIVWLNFDPSSGQEIMKRRPAFVISRKAFNNHVEMAIVAPITSTIRNVKLEVVLPKSITTQGAVLVYQLKSLDVFERDIKFIEKAPKEIIEQAIALTQVITK